MVRAAATTPHPTSLVFVLPQSASARTPPPSPWAPAAPTSLPRFLAVSPPPLVSSRPSRLVWRRHHPPIPMHRPVLIHPARVNTAGRRTRAVNFCRHPARWVGWLCDVATIDARRRSLSALLPSPLPPRPARAARPPPSDPSPCHTSPTSRSQSRRSADLRRVRRPRAVPAAAGGARHAAAARVAAAPLPDTVRIDRQVARRPGRHRRADDRLLPPPRQGPRGGA